MKNFLLLIAACITLTSCGGQVNSPSVPQQKFVPCVNCFGTVFVGDSIFGRLSTNNNFINAGYIDAGVFGQRTDEMLSRLSEIISGQNVCHGFIPPSGQSNTSGFPYECVTLTQQPKEIVIMGGWNNFFQNNPGNTALSDIKQMVSMAQAKGIKVVVCTLYAYDTAHPASWMVPTGNAPVTFYDMWRIPLNQGIENIPSATVVDISNVFSGQSGYTIDGVHPTDAGNNEMLTAIQNRL